MKKLIKLEFNNTTKERKTEDSLSELYSYDKNNGSFEFEILNDTLTTEQVTALFKFTESNKIWKTTGTVEGNKVNVTFDTSLITQNETVICYLYFDEEQRTSDTFRFKFKVKVSEIDKMNRYEVKERYINNTVIVDRLDVVTKEELKEALKNVGGIATEGLLTETRADEIYAKKTDLYDDTALRQRVATLEERPNNNTVYDDSDLRGRVEALENKPDNNTVYDDTVLTNRVKALEDRPTGSSYDDSDLQGRVRALEERPNTTAYDDTDVKRRLTNLEERPDNNTVYDDTDVKNRLKAIEDTQISKEALKDYVRTEDLPAPYNDQRVNERLEALESKTDNDTVYNDTDLKNRVEALENRPTTSVTAYDDTDLKRRVSELEQRPDNNTVYDDTALSNRVRALEDAPKINATDFATKNDLVAFNGELNNKVSSGDFEDFKKTIPAPYNDSELSKRVTALENKPSTGGAVTSTTSSEIRGTGMPNGVVEASIGATYIDTAKTNGALKWIKTTDGGNTGWKVVEGDTGWITIFTKNISIDTKLSLKIRRINNVVNVLFEGELDGEAFIKTFYDNNFSNKKLMANGKITDGFKPASEISVPAHVEKNNSEGFQDAGAFLFDIQNNTFEINLFTSWQLYSSITDGLANINFNYITYEGWPTELPAQN